MLEELSASGASVEGNVQMRFQVGTLLQYISMIHIFHSLKYLCLSKSLLHASFKRREIGYSTNGKYFFSNILSVCSNINQDVVTPLNLGKHKAWISSAFCSQFHCLHPYCPNLSDSGERREWVTEGASSDVVEKRKTMIYKIDFIAGGREKKKRFRMRYSWTGRERERGEYVRERQISNLDRSIVKCHCQSASFDLQHHSIFPLTHNIAMYWSIFSIILIFLHTNSNSTSQFSKTVEVEWRQCTISDFYINISLHHFRAFTWKIFICKNIAFHVLTILQGQIKLVYNSFITLNSCSRNRFSPRS